jgi:hypothetical protein
MQLQARLVHAETGSRVVEASAHRDGALLASALGEAPTAEEAEDRALERLQRRLHVSGQPNQLPLRRDGVPPAQPGVEAFVLAPDPHPGQEPGEEPGPDGAPAVAETPPAPPEPMAGSRQEAPPEPPADPEDWSGELAQIDLELRRLSWQREQEAQYLQRAFGHPSRSRLTTYADLLAYLQALAGLPAGSHPAEAPVPLRRRDLLAQCDQLLTQLGWDAQRGRRCLEEHFGQSSRQQLSEAQLLQFNMVLEEALMALSGSCRS